MSQAQTQALLRRNVAAVEERLQAACRRSGRSRNQITLVAVTKTVDAQVAALLPELGVVHLGENRPQELWRKAAVLPKSVHWHLIGHLQRNKIARTLPLVQLIHSADSLRVLQALETEAAAHNNSVAVLLEMNMSEEPSKQGFSSEELARLLPTVATLQHLRLVGLMTMASLEQEPERCRPTFAALRALRGRLAAQLQPPHTLEHLSMGMSNDFEVAIEEGATLVRIGTALFEGLPKDEA